MKPRYALYALLLALLLFLYFNQVFLDSRIFSERDLSVFFYPNILFWINSIQSGDMPFWNPYIMCGEPLLAAVQPAFLYPLSIIYLIMPPDPAFNLTIVLHFFLSGFFTFLLLKELEASDEAAVIAAIVFVFGGYMLSVHNVLSTLLSAAWFPGVMAVYLRCLRLRSWKHAALCAVFLYCMLTGGGIEILIMASWMLVALSFFPGLHRTQRITLPLAKRLLFAGFVFFSFLALGAVQLLPFIELVQHSVRADGISYKEAVLWSFVPKNILYMLVPDAFWKGEAFYWHDQSWLKTIYTGLLPFLLAGFFFSQRGTRKVLVALFMLGAFFLALGKYNPCYKALFEWVPLLSSVRYPVKYFFIVVFFLSLASGWGWDCFKERIDERGTKRACFLFFVIFAFIGSFFLLALYRYPEELIRTFPFNALFSESTFSQQKIFHNIKRVLFFGILGATGLYVMVDKKKLRPLGFYGITGILLLDLFGGNYGYYQTIERSTLHANTAGVNFLKQDKDMFRVFTHSQITEGKVSYSSNDEFFTKVQDSFLCNVLVERKICSMFGFPVLSLKNYYDLLLAAYRAPLPDATSLLNMMNVKYVLWAEELNCPGYELVQKDEFYLYKNGRFLPRAFLVKHYLVLPAKEEFATALKSPAFNPSELVLFRKEPDVSAWNNEGSRGKVQDSRFKKR